MAGIAEENKFFFTFTLLARRQGESELSPDGRVRGTAQENMGAGDAW